MASESGTFRHTVELHKWSEEQTAAAARQHQVDPDELTHEHFVALGLTPVEHLTVDHAAGTVRHRTADKDYVLSLDQWNRENG